MEQQEKQQSVICQEPESLEMQDQARLQEVLPVHIPAVTDTIAWQEIQNRENHIGPEALLEELLNKKVLEDVEFLWIIRRMMHFYGKEDALLKKAPVRCLMANTNELLRILFLLMDRPKGEIEPNMRSYISAKLQQATWGINQNTRRYLDKINGRSAEDENGNPPVFFL